MKEEFSVTINQVDYHLKRIYHPELPLTYHVHFNDWHQHTVFRMRQDDANEWSIVPMTLPAYVRAAEAALRSAIAGNEAGEE